MGTDALAVVERFVKSMQDGDIEGMLAHIDPRGVFKEAASLPYGGDWVGPEGFAALIETMRSSSEVRLENAEVFPCGERVLLRAELAVRGRATGRNTTVPLVELITVQNGLIVEDEIFYFDTHAVLSVLGDS